jgi:hypothetical protein
MTFIDRDNLRAVLWVWLYCVGLVLGAGALHALGTSPAVIVPLAVLALPVLVSIPFMLTRRKR